ncbi:MAG: SDR family oxidoreductase, partial [Rhodobacteraceae bacterium]|nr:SDR family oxidoreductase [Paracoccaceae bacterium]
SALVLADIAPAALPDGLSAEGVWGDFSSQAAATALIARRPDLIIHLAAIVSGEAELDFDKGYRVNFDGTRALLEAIRQSDNYCPRLLFASTIAVFGAPLTHPVADTHHLTPLTSYGTQKAMTELLISDYTRRGFLDGAALRLPTICVRPGKPNGAASSFFSSIIREPLVGQEAVLPVSTHHRHWFASPRSAAGFFVHGAKIDLSALGASRGLTLPGLSVTVEEQIEALRKVAGQEAVDLIRSEPDEMIEQIVAGWPPGFTADRGRALGFVADESFEHIIREHIADQL